MQISLVEIGMVRRGRLTLYVSIVGEGFPPKKKAAGRDNITQKKVVYADDPILTPVHVIRVLKIPTKIDLNPRIY